MSTHTPIRPPPDSSPRPRVTVPGLAAMRAAGERIAALTCYDASFAALLDGCEVDVLLIGDSLGMVIQGHDSTLPVTLDEVAYHVAAVARGARRALVMADLPFGTFATPQAAFESAARLIRAGAQIVKIEGGEWLAPTVGHLVERGIPVCAHLGLTPQSVHQLGGYRVQGRSAQAAERLVADARALEAAGASALVLEMIPAALAASLTERLAIPTIGIGAGAGCAGQVLVTYDMLGIYPGRRPRFVRDFMTGQPDVASAVRAYVAAVRDGGFPAAEHAF